jgi:hypothetical protein
MAKFELSEVQDDLVYTDFTPLFNDGGDHSSAQQEQGKQLLDVDLK